jgi:hypothetical protein
MNYFGFHKRKLSNGHCAFSHCSFHRDFPEKIILIKRKRNVEGTDTGSISPVAENAKGSGGRNASSDIRDMDSLFGGDVALPWERGLLEELGFVDDGIGALADEVFIVDAKPGEKHTEETKRWTNGAYTGQWQDGKRHGKGVMVWDDGDIYDGDFMFDKRHGRGKYTYTSGNVYEGMWAEDKKDGEGKFLWTSGSSYTGCYRHDQKNGKGLMVRSNGIRQEGLFENDRFCTNISSMNATEIKQEDEPTSLSQRLLGTSARTSKRDRDYLTDGPVMKRPRESTCRC